MAFPTTKEPRTERTRGVSGPNRPLPDFGELSRAVLRGRVRVGVLLSPRGAITYPSANDMSLATNLNLTIMLTNPEAPHE
jgi:hypothetical protein